MNSLTSKLFLYVFLQTLTSWKYAAIAIEIQTKLGSAVHFLLPEVTICGRYNLTDPLNENVIKVYNMSHTHTSIKYARRSTSQTLENGTLLFTMHYIQNSDEGTFLVKPGGHSPQICWRKFVLTVIKDHSSTGYWLSWHPWSSCEQTCGAATRWRLRECSIPNYCFHGDSHETALCNDNPPCYEWSGWSDWSDCSVTCADGWHDRHRYCLTYGRQRISEDHCAGESYNRHTCSMPLCPINQPPTYQWTNWGSWSTCSQSCGTGFQTRDRKCHRGDTLSYSYRCTGLQTDNRTCVLNNCDDENDHTGNDITLNARDQTVQLPLSVVVGIGAGIFILVLTSVICVLFIKLKRKRRILGVVKTGSVKRGNSVSNKIYNSKKASIISCSSQGVSGVHVYDEINSDDVKSQRMSVITIDNPYVAMPKSASPQGPGYSNTGTVTYSNTEETVFVFDNTAIAGQGQCQSQGQGRKVSDTYQNSNNKLSVPRHMSVDSTGYLMPGNSVERAARRNVKYTKNT